MWGCATEYPVTANHKLLLLMLLESSKPGTLKTPDAGEDVEQEDSHSLLVQLQNGTATVEDSLTLSYEN